ncbi:MAG TPA: HAD-IB family hydrolase [Ilumatobacter sp.]|nr:HAD-IB family hydrolase [Ilumatobacter sp.]
MTNVDGQTSSAAGAAFFDLDRTLLRGSSGEVFSTALRTAGLVNRNIPGEKLMYSLFNVVGETLPSMALARQAVRVAKGHSRSAVVGAAEGVAEQLVARVQPLAHSVFEMHREEGRPIILATTSPYDLVKPFADLLGLDDVIATRYGVLDDGDTYDGSLVGPFTWANGKVDAVRTYAAEHGIDLAASFAYSDSVYDTPLLSAVGHPVVVNPDPRMRVMASARRWPILSLAGAANSGGAVESLGMGIQKLVLTFSRPSLVPYADIDIHGAELIPKTGPVILVGNHRSYFDPVVMGMVVAQTGRTMHGLGKKEVFDLPLLGTFASALGGIRVDRASGSEEPLQAAADVLQNGGLIVIMPQGTIPRGPAFFDPELRGRWGTARLAQMTGAPVVPVGLWGTEKVWPRSSRLPKMFNIADAPSVTATVGEPLRLKGKDLDADTKKVMKAIAALLPAASRKKYQPTAEELARTYPPGYAGDPNAESDRRPGTDA